MTRLYCLLILLIPLCVQAHPGVGIVKDSKGNIFYTDLHQVWKIANGKKIIVVPEVHTHELYLDKNDNLFGEGGYYDDIAVKFYHFLWVLRPDGRIDTVVGMKEAYIHQDFSLAKDRDGNEYYLKRFMAPHTDTNHIYKKKVNGEEIILATGNFKSVNWLYPQEDGNILYASENAIYRVDKFGGIKLITDQVSNPDFSAQEPNLLIWGLWQDEDKNVYAALMSHKSIIRIDTSGNITTIFRSTENWAPLQGIFDNNHNLWVLEGSGNNDVRLTQAVINSVNPSPSNPARFKLLPITAGIVILGLGLYYWLSGKSKSRITA